MRFHSEARRIYLAPVLALALIAAASACSSGSSSSSSSAPAATSAPATTAASSPASSATASSGGSSAAVAEIKTNWNEFFSSKTPNSKRVELLQNGSEFTSVITAFAKSPMAAALTSKVDSVTLTSSTEAKVKYDLTAEGTPVASGQTGDAVLQDGTWKVGDDVFCGLLKEGASLIGISVPAACNSAS